MAHAEPRTRTRPRPYRRPDRSASLALATVLADADVRYPASQFGPPDLLDLARVALRSALAEFLSCPVVSRTYSLRAASLLVLAVERWPRPGDGGGP